MQGLNLTSPGLRHDPSWYKRAVFYEVLVRAFADSNGSGAGDFTGLSASSTTCSGSASTACGCRRSTPRRCATAGTTSPTTSAVLPEFGTLPDFTELVSQAHARGLRVIIDLVMNHTSDQHPWFQASRADPDGPYGDFYVWSDTDERYSDARIIFVDTETSNWTFDPVRRQFFWHRFFSHQPDLNFENPDVIEAMLDAVRFWLDLGIDGFRLDAVPYLFEEEGTNCENLPKTHQFLRQLRSVVDYEYPGRVLLAEANQWPQRRGGVLRHRGGAGVPHVLPLPGDAAPVLRDARAEGDADPRHPRRHPGHPVGGPVGHLPAQPRRADARDGHDGGARRHVRLVRARPADARQHRHPAEAVDAPGRLAPRGRAGHAPCSSVLPGSPCLYYGDEIGMGDNIWLADRDAVRTPMQWNPDRNAGFSAADPGKLYLPVVQSLTHHYQHVNVEAQLASPSSLLHWTRAMLSLRRAHPVFGLGSFVPLTTDNEAVLAFLRVLDAGTPGIGGDAPETVLCVMNLSQNPQAVVVQTPGLGDAHLVDLFGGARFPSVPEIESVQLTLGSRDFYWLGVRK